MRPLTLLHILEYYDVPQIITATDALGTYYLCTLISHNNEGYQYLGVQISEPRLLAFMGGQLDLRETYLHPEAEGALWIVSVKGGRIEAVRQLLSSEITEEMLPETGYYYDPSDSAEETEGNVDTYRLVIPANDRITFSTLISRMGWKASALRKSRNKLATL